MYRIVLSEGAQKDYSYWVKSGNIPIVKRINALLTNMAESPYTGIGKPEALKYSLSGKWSRRINDEHRIVYSVHEDTIEVHVFSMKYHYAK
jgi:toxin YoeB